MSELVLRFERTFGVPRAAVWGALTNPTQLAQWWGPHGFTNVIDTWDLRVGGTYRITMTPPGGEAFHLGGVFREVQPDERLTYTFVWEEPHPEDIPAEVAVTLVEREGATDMTIEHGPFPNEARMEPPRGGWTEGLEKLERSLNAHSSDGGSSASRR